MSKSYIPCCHGQLEISSLHQQTKQGSRSGNVHPAVENHELVSPIQNITLCQNIPGCLNVISDFLSRLTQIQSTEWLLNPQAFKRICQKWFIPQVNMFATRLSHKLPLYASPVPDQQTSNIDTLNISWSGLVTYAYPPTVVLLKLVQKVCQFKCLLILVAPGWPDMHWFRDVVQLSVEILLQWPVSPILHKQPSNQVFHNNSQYLNLHASCLGVRNSENKASLVKWERIAAPQRAIY